MYIFNESRYKIICTDYNKKYRGSLQTKGYKVQTLVVDKILYYIFLVPFQLCYWTIQPFCTGFLNCKMSIIAAATS